MYVGERCWWKMYVGEKFMLVKLFHWNMHVGENFHQHAAFTHIFKQILCWWKPSEPNIWSLIKIGWWSIRSFKVYDLAQVYGYDWKYIIQPRSTPKIYA